MGLGMLQLLRLQGARTIIAIDRVRMRARRRWNLVRTRPTIPATCPSTTWSHVGKIGISPGGVDVAIDATGTQRD
jgi:threonine dehydrogenase-like Zn-dependent dehydrogenase